MKTLHFLVIVLAVLTGLFGFTHSAAAQEPVDRVEKSTCASAIGYGSLDALKQDLLLGAKRAAVDELFGELINATSVVEDFVVTTDEIRSTSLGFVRIDSSPQYANGANLAEVCITVVAYVTQEDRAQFVPVTLSKRYCEGDPKLTTGEIQERTKENAIIQALLEYDPRLEEVATGKVRRLMQRITYSDSGFVPETETYCTTVNGEVVPVQVLAVLGGADLLPVAVAPVGAGLEKPDVQSSADGTQADSKTADGTSIAFSTDGATLAPPWKYVPGDAGLSSYAIDGDTLHLVTKGECSSDARYDRGRGARAVIPVQGDFSAVVQLSFAPIYDDYHAAGVYISAPGDPANRIGILREFNRNNDQYSENLIGAEATLSGEISWLGSILYTKNYQYFQVTRKGDLYTLAASEHGRNWVPLITDHLYILPDEVELSLYVHNACADQPVTASFSNVAIGSAITPSNMRPGEVVAFAASDDGTQLADYWRWSPGISEGSTFRVTDNALTIVTGPKTDHYRDVITAPRVFVPLTTDFVLETTIKFASHADWQMAGISVRDSTSTDRAEIRLGGRSEETQILEATDTVNAKHHQVSVVDYPDSIVRVRISRTGPFIDFEYSSNGEDWQSLLEDYVTSIGNDIRLSFYVYSTVDSATSATFSDIMLETE